MLKAWQRKCNFMDCVRMGVSSTLKFVISWKYFEYCTVRYRQCSSIEVIIIWKDADMQYYHFCLYVCLDECMSHSLLRCLRIVKNYGMFTWIILRKYTQKKHINFVGKQNHYQKCSIFFKFRLKNYCNARLSTEVTFETHCLYDA